MRYKSVELHIDAPTTDVAGIQAYQDVLAALLGDIGFESFEETASGMTAYIPDEHFDAIRLEETILEFPFPQAKISYEVSDVEERDWNAAWNKVYKMLSEEEIAALVPTYIKAYTYFQEKRIRDIAERYGSRVDSWDVVNESATDYHRWQDEKAVRGTPCQKSVYGLMPGDYTYKGFQWAAKYMPKTAWLNLNDYNMAPYFFKQAKDLEANGCRVDVVGSQMHLFNPAESVNIALGKGPEHLRPEGIAARFELLSNAGKPIHLSEITITAPDMRPKTAYFAMDDLINREWKTQTTAKASGGKVSFRGFRGRYRLAWKGKDGKEQTKLVELK